MACEEALQHAPGHHPDDVEIAQGMAELQAADDCGDIPLLLRIEMLSILTDKLYRRSMESRRLMRSLARR